MLNEGPRVRLYGVSPIELIDGTLWFPPHTAISGDVQSSMYHNPVLLCWKSLVNVERQIAVAQACELPARVMDNVYKQEGWHNSWFDYNEIELDKWPHLPVTPSKYGNKYRALQKKTMERPVHMWPIEPETVRDNLPKLVYEDASAAAHLPIYFHDHAQGLKAFGYYDAKDNLIAISIMGFDVTNNVLFNYGLIRIDESYSASELTYWLCGFARNSGFTHLDIFNMGLTRREEYKKMFFTGSRKAYCWTNNLEHLTWVHKLENENE